MQDAINYVHIYAWPPIGTTEGAKQLVSPKMPKGIVCVHQQLCTGHKWWYVHPMLGQAGHGWEKDLQFFTACPIYLPQLPKLGGLVHVFRQPAHPEVVNERPILGYVGHFPQGYCALTGLAKPWPIMQSYAHWTRRYSPCSGNGCNSCRVSWWENHSPAHTMYMDGHPMALWPIQARQLHTHKRSATD